MIRNLGLYVALRAGSWLLPLFPLRAAYALASFAGTCAFYLLPRSRRAIAANLSRVMGAPAESERVLAAARQAFENDARNWVDTLRIGRLTDEEILRSVDLHGWEYIQAALSQGRGAIIVMMHLGNFDLVGQTVAAHGEHLTIPVERMRPQALFDFLLQARTSKGVNAVPVDRAPRELLRALRRGEMVAVAGDRNAGGRGIRVPFFGAEATLPRGPVTLARHSGAPLLVGAGIRRGTGRYQGLVTPPLPLQRTADSEADDRENARRVAAAMESFISRFPEQWLVFAPVWEDGGDGKGPATIGNQMEAVV
jgi:lauroyl/myristoyl acyltransferase